MPLKFSPAICLFFFISSCVQPESDFSHLAVPDNIAVQTSRFEKQVLMTNLTDPMEVAVAKDGRVFVVERGGAIHQWDPESGQSQRIGYIPVYMVIEDGLLGLALDPDFEDNGWLYVFYGPADGGDSRLSRFTVANDHIDPTTEKVLLEVPMQREACCHAGGSLAFGPKGNLYLAVGDNTDHIDLAGGPIDERPGHSIADAQLTSSNTNDLRGKILRIRPERDGTYSIPEGNLFEGDALHRGEIYTMGHRNPFRISIDPETGWLYFGDVGNGDPPNERGGWGWDEFNQARVAGNFGWPYVVGNNQPYSDFNYATKEIGAPFDPVKLINDSPNNTGARELPPAQPAMIWYTFGESEEFPLLGSGGINPMAGPVYRRANTHAAYALPDYYIGKHFIYDWMRNWVLLVSFDENGDYKSMESFLPGMDFSRPIDIEAGPDGALYIIEWGRGFWGSNADAQVVRVVFHGDAGWRQKFEELNYAEEDWRVMIKQPLAGSFFSFDESFSFDVELLKPIEGGEFKVTLFTGFDTNKFELDRVSSSTGSFTVTREFTHVPDLHYVDRFAEVEACYVLPDSKPDSKEQCASHKLNLYNKEAEHVYSLGVRSASRYTYGIQPASAAFAETALTVMRVKDGGRLSYAPINLAGIATIKLRYKLFHPAELTLLTQSKREVAKIDLHAASGQLLPELPQASVLDRLEREGQGHVIERLERAAYQGWREIAISVPELQNPAIPLVLNLDFKGESEDVLIEIDALEFIPR